MTQITCFPTISAFWGLNDKLLHSGVKAPKTAHNRAWIGTFKNVLLLNPTKTEASMSQELTCSSLTTLNYSEWRSTQRFLSTSTSLLSLSPVTTTFVRSVTYVHSWHLTQPRPWQFLSLAVDLIIVTVYYIACCRLTLIGYSVFKVF